MQRERFAKYVNLADACELLSATFSFPREELADALTDGSYVADMSEILSGLGVESAAVNEVCEGLIGFRAANANELTERLKRGYSLLFLAPGAKVPVWPYEAAFLYVASGRAGAPSLFRSPVTLDVEDMMRAAGVKMAADDKEPCDSIWHEFAYLSFVFGSAAQAVLDEDEERAKEWLGHGRSFVEKHVVPWVPAFLAAVEAERGKHSFGDDYATLAAPCKLLVERIITGTVEE